MGKEPIEIVAVSGAAGHGKGTVGKALDLFHDYTVVSLANVFKVELVLFGDGELVKEVEGAGYTVRRAWQQVGESKGAVNLDLWSERLGAWIHYLAELHPAPRRRFAVCDFRMPEEERFLRSFAEAKGAALLQVDVVRPGVGNRAGTTHRSESAQKQLRPDIRLKNDGSRADLARAVAGLLPGAWKFAGRGSGGHRPYTVSSVALATGREFF